PFCSGGAGGAGRAVTATAVNAGFVPVQHIVVAGEVEDPGRVEAVVKFPARCRRDLVNGVPAVRANLDTVLRVCRSPGAGEGQHLRCTGLQQGGVARPEAVVIDIEAGYRDSCGGSSLVPDRVFDGIVSARGRAFIEDIADD